MRVNPLAPYNALNYGLGLSSCTFRAYIEGMVGAVPYTCLAVYAGMLVSSVEDIDSMFSHTSPMWYSLYAMLGVFCLLSLFALVRYTAAEMKAAVVSSPTLPMEATDCDDGDGDLGDMESRRGRDPSSVPRSNNNGGEGRGGYLPEQPSRDSTMFGTFTTRGEEDGSDGREGEGEGEEMTTFDDSVVSREPLLGVGGESFRGGKPVAGVGGKPSIQERGRRGSSFVDV